MPSFSTPFSILLFLIVLPPYIYYMRMCECIYVYTYVHMYVLNSFTLPAKAETFWFIALSPGSRTVPG